MAIKKYRTKAGLRYLVEVYQDGVRVVNRGGFESKLAALEWERDIRRTQTSNCTPSGLALFEVVTLYLLDAEQRRKKNTVSYKKSVLKKFIAHAGANTSFAEINRSIVKEFLNAAARSVSPKSANKYRIELSAMWSWAQVEGHAASNPSRQVESYPVIRSVRYVPPKEHIAKVLALSSQFERDFITALLHTAGRVSELRELAWEDVDLDRGVLRLWTSKRRGGDREARHIAISPTLRTTLERLNEARTGGENMVFTNPLTGYGYTRQSREVKYLFPNICKKAEVPHFSAHSLRHFMATHFNDPRRAQKILGHANLKTTEIYLHELGVDMEAAGVFESITNEITNSTEKSKNKGATVVQ